MSIFGARAVAGCEGRSEALEIAVSRAYKAHEGLPTLSGAIAAPPRNSADPTQVISLKS